MAGLRLNTIESSTSFSGRNSASAELSLTRVNETRFDAIAPPIETLTKGVHSFIKTQGSRTLAELRKDPVFGSLWQEPQSEPPSALEITRDHRLAILAQEFEGVDLSREDQARLAILTHRLRRLSPSVTARSWTVAEEILTELESVSAHIDAIGAKYGL